MTPEEMLLLTYPTTVSVPEETQRARKRDDEPHVRRTRSETPVVPIRVPDGETKLVKW